MYVAVSVNDKVEVHIHGLWGYDTLCGLDAHDSGLSHQPAKVPAGAKIDCKRCAAIFRECSLLRVSDFTKESGASVTHSQSEGAK